MSERFEDRDVCECNRDIDEADFVSPGKAFIFSMHTNALGTRFGWATNIL